jgi:hypothetical protein
VKNLIQRTIKAHAKRGYADGGEANWPGADQEAAANLASQGPATPSLGQMARGVAAMPGRVVNSAIDTAIAAAGDPVGTIGNALTSVASVPKRFVDANAEDMQHFGESGYQPKATAPAFETAMTLAGAGMGAAESGAAGIFGGKLSKMADHPAMVQAEAMERAGAAPAEIWNKMQTARGADGKWRQEIDDSAARLNLRPDQLEEGQIPGSYLDEVLHHPELYKAYPNLRNMVVEPLPADVAKTGTWGDFNAQTNTIRLNKSLSPDQARSTLLHEAQHSVQGIEDFAKGDNPSSHMPAKFSEAESRLEDVKGRTEPQIASRFETNQYGVEMMKQLIRNNLYGAQYPIPPLFVKKFGEILAIHPEVKQQLTNIVRGEKTLYDVRQEAMTKYRSAMGEAESRNVQKRSNLTAAQRAGSLPESTEDIPRPLQRNPGYADGGATPAGDPWAAFNPEPAAPAANDPWAAFNPEGQPAAPQTSVGADVAKSAGVGLGKGLIDMVGLPGDASNLLTKGVTGITNTIADTFGLDRAPEPAGPVLPTSGGIQKAIESKTGEFYQPKTTAGKFAGAAAETLGNPVSYVGPGGLIGKAASAAATGLGSEAAGEVAHEYMPEAEPYARFAGGLLGGTAAGGLSAATANTMRARGIQTTASLQAASNQAYAGARSLGVEYTPSNLVLLRDRINADLLRQGHRADLSGATFRRIQELPDPPTAGIPLGNRNFSDIEGVRQSLNKVGSEVDALGRPTADARAAGIAINHIDRFLGDPMNAIPGHRVIAQQAADLANEGRSNWAAMKRSDAIEQALEKSGRNAAATGSGANIDNTMRQQIRNILNNPRRAKNFTNDDRNIMEDIVAGNPIRNSARLFGKLAATGAVSLAASEYLAHTMGLGPIGHAAIPAIGYGMKKGAEIGTRNNYNRLLEGIRMDSAAGRANPVAPRQSIGPYAARAAATTPTGNPYAP